MGNPIYCDHPEGRLIFGPAAVVLLYSKANLDEYFKRIRCGDTMIVGQLFEGSLLLFVASNGGESEHFLRRQLHVIHDLLAMRLSPQLMWTVGEKEKFKSMKKYRKAMHEMIDTYDYLCDHQQSHLVQSIEWLEVNEDIRSRCQTELERGLNIAPSASHAILLSGTKVVAIYSKTRAFELTPSEVCLLIIYLQSLFNPKTKNRVFAETPVSDYSEIPLHGQEVAEPEAAEVEQEIENVNETEDVSNDDGFESATEEFDGEESNHNASSVSIDSESPQFSSTTRPVGIPKTPSSSNPSDFAESVPMATPAGSFVDYGAASEAKMSTSTQLPSANPTLASVALKAPSTSVPPGLGSSADDVEKVKCYFEPLYLRTPQYARCWVYASELTESTTLVIINSNTDGNEQEKKRLDTVRKSVLHRLRTYMSFIETRGDTHITMLSFLHMFPGLVHFIFVDRISNTVTAPSIIPLHGQQHNMNDAAAVQSIKLIKGKVWDMCYKAQRQLSLGFTATIMKLGDFQYSYKLWVEDSEGNEIPIEKAIPANLMPVEWAGYRELLQRLFPSQRGLRMYELYTLYVGMLPTAAVVSHNKRLYSHIMGKSK
eukprot:TRINITY_DN5513_c0_g1_i1.p1 TRINITY_DN5513_c0_g1~~TRINITY_DN5513_c0_g1_i1.p1  ORF type:complete len:598 (-),score=128.82 TRINITY_DN5513_c0_g1_i1:220-2013(-)